MWVVAGVLLGLVLLTSLLGYHTGPQSHVAAGVLGVIAAVWLAVMALDGRSSSVLWALFSADMVVAGGASVIAWKGLSGQHRAIGSSSNITSVVGKQGVAVSDLVPEGIVRVRGENWSASSLNGEIKAGAPIQVLSVSGIRLEVWGEANPVDAPVALQIESDTADVDAGGTAPDTREKRNLL